MSFPPKHIVIESDGNELEFTRKDIINKKELFVFKYSKSECKLGMEVSFLKEEIEKQLNNYFKAKE